MNKKLIALLLVIALATSGVFAVGLGIQLGGLISANSLFNLAITLKLDSVPLAFAIDGGFGPSWVNLGLTTDYWIMNPNIKGVWNWFWGAGLGLYADILRNSAGFAIGPRLLIGMNWRFTKVFELYLQGAWQPRLGFGSVYVGELNYRNNFYFNLVNFPINVGIRFWF